VSQYPAIDIRELVKRYKGMDSPALDGISFEVPEGEIFGLLGPNGAGKTTTISILCGIFPPTKGEVSILGKNIGQHIQAVRHTIGVVPQEIALYPTLTARENLRFIGNMYGLRGKELNTRIDECLVLLGLDKSARRMVRTYSGGMKRRINLIAGILHKPRILFLDEPTVGIDVQSRAVIMEYLKKLNAEGTTIIYTSHMMQDAEQFCNSIAIIDHGKIIAQGRPKELIGSQPGYTDLENIFLQLTGRHLRDN
jgi:ABC-2 type transport system ATP-binding protein